MCGCRHASQQAPYTDLGTSCTCRLRTLTYELGTLQPAQCTDASQSCPAARLLWPHAHMASAATNAANTSDEMDVWVGHLSATTKVMSETVLTWAFNHLRLLGGSLPVMTPRLAFAQQYRPSAHVVGVSWMLSQTDQMTPNRSHLGLCFVP
jgi:hypothetical protein